jgi:glycerophosphoryl diester phosphodiesterase
MKIKTVFTSIKKSLPILLLLTSSLNLSVSAQVSNEIQPNKVVAHRGAWKTDSLPQNSIASFRRAVELGCAGSEFDVYLTADSVLILNHDADFQGLPVEKSTLQELQKKPLSNGESIPLLDDVLKLLVKQTQTLAFLEIKPSAVGREHGLAAVDKVLAIVEHYQAQDKVFYISFDYSYLQRIKEKHPDARTAFLGRSKPLSEIIAEKQFGIDFNQQYYKENETLIPLARQNGISVNVWTVNQCEDMHYFLEQGVDYITTDEPLLLLMEEAKFRNQ